MAACGELSTCGSWPTLPRAGLYAPRSLFLECVQSGDVTSSDMPLFSLILSV